MALLIGVISLGPAPTFGATGGEDSPMQRLAEFRGRVVVGADGNGVLSDRFQTAADGPEVRHFLDIVHAPGTGVPGLTITLNEDVVFQSDDELPDSVRVEVALNPVGTEMNSIVVAARGAPGIAAAVSVVAVRPAAVPFGAVSILPLAMSDAHARTSLTLHNVGPSPLAFRIAFFNPDGSLAGRTSPQVLSARATKSQDLGQFARISQIQWSRGAIHVQWASHGFTRMSAAATFHREPREPGSLDAVLALDNSDPHPLSRAELQDISGE